MRSMVHILIYNKKCFTFFTNLPFYVNILLILKLFVRYIHEIALEMCDMY